jgi:hypothetical protein
MRRTPLRSRTGLRRTDGLSRSTELRRETRLSRSTRLAAVNPTRKARLYRQQFGAEAELIRRMPCCACWPHLYREDRPLPSPGPARVSDPSHTKTRGAGGKREHQVPHCRDHHRWFEGQGRHRNSRHQDQFGVHTGRLAARLHLELAA